MAIRRIALPELVEHGGAFEEVRGYDVKRVGPGYRREVFGGQPGVMRY